MPHYKLMFGVRDVTGKTSEREATGLEPSSFFDVHEFSQITINVDPDELEKHIDKVKKRLPVLSEATLDSMRRDFVRELAIAACDLAIRSMSGKIVEHAKEKIG